MIESSTAVAAWFGRSTLEAALTEDLCPAHGCRAETGSEPALAERHLEAAAACRAMGPERTVQAAIPSGSSPKATAKLT